MLALTVANPDPTETWDSFTVLALIQTSVAKVCSLSACSLSGQWTKDNEVLPSFCLFARVFAELAFVCNDQLNPICWFANELVSDSIRQQQISTLGFLNFSRTQTSTSCVTTNWTQSARIKGLWIALSIFIHRWLNIAKAQHLSSYLLCCYISLCAGSDPHKSYHTWRDGLTTCELLGQCRQSFGWVNFKQMLIWCFVRGCQICSVRLEVWPEGDSL